LDWTANGSWTWTIRRLAISAFLVVHLSATGIWLLPSGAIRNHFGPIAKYYILPLGQWQFWAMFAPDPVRDTITLEAEVIDANGVRYAFAFPRLADYNWWQGIPRFRYSKYAANLSAEEFATPREFAARHVVRRLKLPASVYPVSVHLLYQIRKTPPPATDNPAPQVDGTPPVRPYVIGTLRFESASEVNP
jgi:hypothetical protein